MRSTLIFLAILFAPSYGQAQTALDTIEVSTARQLTPLRSALRTIGLLRDTRLQSTGARTVSEALEQIPSLDLRHRGPLDIQVDPGIRGGTFDQTLVLVNGIKMTDPQTGHHQMNLPIGLGDIQRAEVLESGGSRIYGPNAFSGAIHLHTPVSGPDRLRATLCGGSYGLFRADVQGQINTGSWFSYASVSGAQSDGYRSNTDFTYGNVWAQTGFIRGDRQLLIQGGYNAKAFGAQDFYSSRYAEQFEATRTLLLSARYSGGTAWRYMVQGYARQHNDHFELFREDDAYYTYRDGVFVTGQGDTAVFFPGVTADWNYYRGHNDHRTRVVGGEASLSHEWGRAGTTSIGIEMRQEGIVSNVLGKDLDKPIDVWGQSRGQYLKGDQRTNGSAYVEHGARWGRWTWNGGVLINTNSAFGADWLPGLDVGYRVAPSALIYASADRSFRFPTFTDLYYNLGGARGSADLQPEYSVNLELGARVQLAEHATHLARFQRDGRELIDWVQWKPDSLQAENLTRVTMRGVTVGWGWTAPIRWLDHLHVGYTGLWAESEALGVPSLYVLDHLRHKVVLTGQHTWNHWSLSWMANLQDRAGQYVEFPSGQSTNYETVFLLDLSIRYTRPAWSVYLSGSNLLDREYVDRGNVIQPGLWVQGGVQVDLVR